MEPGELADEPFDIDPLPRRIRHACFRLAVLSSSILHRKQKVAVLNGFDEVSIGRDRSSDPTAARLRLKEMAVSKFHASVYWDSQRAQWAVVDMGSKHGTFVRSCDDPSSSAGLGSGDWCRISGPGIASMPRALRHGDRIHIGSTVFEVHHHADDMACAECALTADNEIPLSDPRSSDAAPRKRPLEEAPAPPPGPLHKDAKKALASLRHAMLSQKFQQPLHADDPQPAEYTDRAARRRAFHPDFALRPGAYSATSPPPPPAHGTPPAVENPPSRRIAAGNLGHQLLLKQGWSPGHGLGLSDDATVDPLSIALRTTRAGIGAGTETVVQSTADIADADYRSDGKQKRWAELSRVRSDVMNLAHTRPLSSLACVGDC